MTCETSVVLRTSALCSMLLSSFSFNVQAASKEFVSHGSDTSIGGAAAYSVSRNVGPSCSFKEYAGVLLVREGIVNTMSVDIAVNRAVLFDISPTVEAAMNTKGDVDAKADALDKAFWPYYQITTTRIATRRPLLTVEKLDTRTEQFALIGHGANGKPKAILLSYHMSYIGAKVIPTRSRRQLQRDDYDPGEPEYRQLRSTFPSLITVTLDPLGMTVACERPAL